MKLNDLRPPKGAYRHRKRVGRGTASGHGKTAGRGTKGQKARTGGNVPPRFQGGQTPIHKQLPYKRGFTNIWKERYYIVNLEALNRARFEAGMQVTPEVLVQKGILRDNHLPLKILGDGELTVALNISAHKVSNGALQKIEAAGGTVNLIELPATPRRSKGRTEAPVRAHQARQAAKQSHNDGGR